ncbi:DUF2510 domain-containing protein [Protaetiibacter intestinalis]|uniref:DUF2510 domain-containing protein n=1 Tax=Protaetiibacter intestinalis TaxID=2419774 RepID=A0A387B941_9MICO|nr:DUF2510 domain-containing protein [Protaetiibacter intestinalis]
MRGTRRRERFRPGGRAPHAVYPIAGGPPNGDLVRARGGPRLLASSQRGGCCSRGRELVSLSAAAPVAAWYPDPTDADLLRWWDGLGWTSHTRPRPAQPPASLPMPDPATAYIPEAPPTAAPVNVEPMAGVAPPSAQPAPDPSQIAAALAAAPAPAAGTAGIAAVPSPTSAFPAEAPPAAPPAPPVAAAPVEDNQSVAAARAAFAAAQAEKAAAAAAAAAQAAVEAAAGVASVSAPVATPSEASIAPAETLAAPAAAPASPAAGGGEDQFTSVAQARAAFAAKRAAAAEAKVEAPAEAAPSVLAPAPASTDDARPVSVAAARAAAAKAKAEAAAQATSDDQQVDEHGRKWHLPKFN